MASNNVASAVFANAAPASSFNWGIVGIICLVIAITIAIAYFIYMSYMKSTWAFPFQNSGWINGTTYVPQLITSAQDAMASRVTSDHTKLTGETMDLTGMPVEIKPPSHQPSATPAHIDDVAAKQPDVGESWCFVGEDLSGRYCVKVPKDSACTKDRVYHSRSDCEMAAANHLPAGVIKKNGEGIQLLGTMNIV